jgi:hypothetical protein
MTIKSSAAWCVCVAAGVAAAQTTPKEPAPAPAGGATVATGQVVVRSSGDPRRDTLTKMMSTATVEFKETRLEEVMRWVQATSGADMDVLWMDEQTGTGLDKDTAVTAKFENRTVLDIVEAVMERFGDSTGSGGGATWQMSQSGAIQISTKDRLNKFRRVEVYPIRDLLLETPNYTNSYELDLQQALQAAGQQGGGGGGQSPFQQNNEGEEQQRRNVQEKANEIIDILTQLIEPDQWQQNGGEAASIRFFQGALLVNAPDYIHRGLNGYPWWSRAATRVSHSGGRRYVSMSMDAATNQLQGMENQPITATTGGGDLVRPGGGG